MIHKGCFINEEQAAAMLSWIRLCSLCLDMLRKGLADDQVLQLHHLILEQHRVVKDELKKIPKDMMVLLKTAVVRSDMAQRRLLLENKYYPSKICPFKSSPQMGGTDTRVVWVPHMTASLHRTDAGLKASSKRPSLSWSCISWQKLSLMPNSQFVIFWMMFPATHRC
jgi:hypothetical protein